MTAVSNNDLDGTCLRLESPSVCIPKKMGSKYLSLGRPSPSPIWFDIRVFYVRVSACTLDEASESLIMRFFPRSVGTGLEVNGGRVSPAESAFLKLRRDRVDTESAEATYVSTDNLRTTGSLPFDVYHTEDLLLCGLLDRSDSLSDSQALNLSDSVATLTEDCRIQWRMECYCAITSPKCGFVKGRGDFTTPSFCSPSMEVYVAGRFSCLPVILTQTVQLAVRRRMARRGTLDSIPEADESERSKNGWVLADLADQIEEQRVYEEMEKTVAAGISGYYISESGGCVEGDDGELTWFNAGVRVGVGIGLGICLGIGIGVGLLIRTYQATTRTFSRRFF
eukprot:c25857_g2_i1 orf=836-1846(-)